MVRFLSTLAGLLLFATAARAGEPGHPCGVVFVVGGVGGWDPLGPAARLALPHAGVPYEIREVRWTHGIGRILRDLQDTRHLLAHASALAAEVRRLKEEHPERPIYLIGHSAGTGLVLAALEHLPPATVERTILLSPAVSPRYDLRPALRATRREIISFHSVLDRFWLDWGTSQFGTVDRFYMPAAGVHGFVVPDPLDTEGEVLYARLVQIGWTPKMLLEHHAGWHHSTVLPGFLTHHVVPWLLPGE